MAGWLASILCRRHIHKCRCACTRRSRSRAPTRLHGMKKYNSEKSGVYMYRTHLCARSSSRMSPHIQGAGTLQRTPPESEGCLRKRSGRIKYQGVRRGISSIYIPHVEFARFSHECPWPCGPLELIQSTRAPEKGQKSYKKQEKETSRDTYPLNHANPRKLGQASFMTLHMACQLPTKPPTQQL